MASPDPALKPTLISVDDARAVEPDIKAPDSLAHKESDHAHVQAITKAEQGWIGRMCGSKGEKPGNVAFLVILGSFVLISAALYVHGLTDPFFKLLSALLGVVGLALGYLFGSQSKH